MCIIPTGYVIFIHIFDECISTYCDVDRTVSETMSCVYLIHFERKLGHAQHYIGWTKYTEPWRRFEYHISGRGSHLTKAACNQGIGLRLVRIWKNGDRALERYLKRKKKARTLCPICNAKMNKHLIRQDRYDHTGHSETSEG